MQFIQNYSALTAIVLLVFGAELPAAGMQRLEDPDERPAIAAGPRFINDPRVNHLPQKLRTHALEFQEAYGGIENPDVETNVFSKYLKGIILVDGIGQAQDLATGRVLLEQVREAGFNPEARDIPNFHQRGHPLHAQAAAFYGRYGTIVDLSAERGNPIGQYLKGLMLSCGIGVPANEDRAFHLILASAQSGLYLRSAEYIINHYNGRLGESLGSAVRENKDLLENPASIEPYLRAITGPRKLDYAEMHDFESQLYMLPGSTARHFELYGRLVERLDGLVMTVREAPITPGKVWGSVGLLSLSGGFLGFGINRFIGGTHETDVGSVLTGVTAQLSFNAVVGFLKGLGDVGKYCSRIRQTASAAFCCRRTTVPPLWQLSDIEHEVRMTALFLTLHTYATTNSHTGDMDALVFPRVRAVERLLSHRMTTHYSLPRWVNEMSADANYPEFHNIEAAH